MKIFVTSVVACLAASALGQSAGSAQAWQRMQMPTAAEVQRVWMAPPAEYGPEPYYGLNGAVDVGVIRRDLDTMKRLGYGAVTVQYGYGARLRICRRSGLRSSGRLWKRRRSVICGYGSWMMRGIRAGLREGSSRS